MTKGQMRMQPPDYLDMQLMAVQEGLPEKALRKVIKQIVDHDDEAAMASLLNEQADNRHRKQFLRRVCISLCLMGAALVLLIWAGVIGNNRGWQAVASLGTMALSFCIASSCRGTLTRYLRDMFHRRAGV
jgi:hypothetical protein